MKSVLSFIKDILLAVLIALIIIQFIKPTVIKESSMEPNFHENDYVLLSKQAYTLFGDIQYGDVIVFHSDIDGEKGKKDLIKRVVGLSGDNITVKDGQVIRNDKVVIEGYIYEEYTSGYVDNLEIPEGEIFVMGDNRRVSLDSRSEEIGTISEEKIIGKAIFKVYPFKEFGKIH